MYRWPAALAAVASMMVVALGLPACHRNDVAFSPAPPTTPASVSPARASYQPPPNDNPNDPLLIVYCSTQDKIITLEGPLLSKHMTVNAMARNMKEAGRLAAGVSRTFAEAGERQLEQLARDWSNSFELVIARLRNGMRPIDALRPAISALGRIEHVFTCELDG